MARVVGNKIKKFGLVLAFVVICGYSVVMETNPTPDQIKKGRITYRVKHPLATRRTTPLVEYFVYGLSIYLVGQHDSKKTFTYLCKVRDVVKVGR